MHTHLQKGRAPGFTIVELLIVIAVIGVLVALSFVAYNGIQQNARDKSILSDIDAVAGEVTRYGTKNNGVYGPAVQWYSAAGANANIQFTPSSGNVIDVVASTSEYCVRGYNPKSNKNSINNAESKGSSTNACSLLPASAASGGSAPVIPSSWTDRNVAAGTKNWTAVAMSSDGTKMYATASGESMWRSTNGGVDWTELTAAGSRNWSDVAVSADGTKIVALASSSVLYRSTDSGATWGTSSLPVGSLSYNYVASSADGTKIIAGDLCIECASAAISTNSGASWTKAVLPGNEGPALTTSVATNSDGTVMVLANDQDYVYVSLNSGSTWTYRNVVGNILAISQNGTIIAALNSEGGLVSMSTNSGAIWSITAQTAGYGLAMSGSGAILFVSPASGIPAMSLNAGVTWAPVPNAGSRSWRDLAVSSDGTRYVGVVQGGYIRTGQ